MVRCARAGGVSADIVARLHSVLAQIMCAPELIERITREASIPIGGTPREFADYLRTEIVKWENVIRISGAKVD